MKHEVCPGCGKRGLEATKSQIFKYQKRFRCYHCGRIWLTMDMPREAKSEHKPRYDCHGGSV
jgi:hypothetical protein